VAPPPHARPLPPRPIYPPPGYQPTAQLPTPGIPYSGPVPPPPPRPTGSTVPPWNLPHPGAFTPRKSNTGAIVATVLVAVLLVAAGMVGVLTLTDKKKDRVADTNYDYPASTAEPTTTTERTTRATTRTTTATTTRATTTTAGTTSRSTTTRPAGPQPVRRLGDHPLFAGDVGAPAVTCQLARWQTNPSAAATFFQSAIPCLEATWLPLLQRAGLPYRPPGLEVPAGNSAQTPCSGNEGRSFAAFYCPRNHTIYLPFGTLQTDLYGARPGVYLAVLAHEFGHHVQAVSGIWEAYWDARYDAGADTEAGLELSRRAELQAQCFSGMFLAATYPRGSVDKNILQEARNSEDRGDHNPGEPRDHGSDQHYISWWEQGAQRNRTYACNTWLANPADVS
jgi:predicted metalloprotease